MELEGQKATTMKHLYIKTILLSLCLFAGMKAFAEVIYGVEREDYDAKIDGIYYNFYGNNAIVTYRYNVYHVRREYDEYGELQEYYYLPDWEVHARSDYSGDVVIPESVTYNGKTYSVTSIGDYAFYACGVTSITIPNSVTSISYYAFDRCEVTSLTINCSTVGSWFSETASIQQVTLGESVTSIDDFAFLGCSGLTSVIINCSIVGSYWFQGTSIREVILGENVTSIDSGAFYGSWLNSVTIGNSVTSIGEYAFGDCGGLTSIIVENGNPKFDSRNNCNAIIATKTNTLVVGCKNTIIPNSVTCIGEEAFCGCSSLTSITIPESVTCIGMDAFCGCNSLISITIPESVTYIGDQAFYGCSSLTSVTINCPTVGSWFSGITSIEEVTLGDCVTSIGGDAFLGTAWYNNQPNGLVYAGKVAYKYKGTMPEGTEIMIEEGTLGIADYAFSGCTNLTSISIPNSMMNIGDHAFYGCSTLTDVYCHAENVPLTGSNSFNNSHISSATLHVPGKSLTLYKATSPWCEFGKIISIDNIYTLTYIVDGDVYKTYEVEYNSPITPEPGPTKEGYTFSGWSEIPGIMPEEDVTITGTFTVNSYILNYIVDGEVYKTDAVAYGAEITPEPAPTKEGYTFSGWSYIPPTMPATDVVVMGTFTINSYALTYVVDGEEYKTSTVTYGSAITPEEEPTKEGYTFSGWSEIPETMPAGDVTVTGSFSPNGYTLLYIVDGEEYKTESVAYGTTITPEAEPTKEGYTFSGWSEIPETMPAEDVTVTGSFTINQYLLTYILDGEEYRSYEIDYNTALTPEPAPTKKGMTFSGWGEMPETMPAHDVTLTGAYTWSKETVDGVTYQVADTLSNYATIVGYEGESGETTLLSEIEIDGDIYTVYGITNDALPHTIMIYTSIGRLLLNLWTNGYTDIRETETGNSPSAPEVSLVGATASSLKLSFANPYPELTETLSVSGTPVEKGENGYEIALNGLEPDNLYDELASVTLTYEDASYTKSYSYRTKPLTLTALQPKVVSIGNVIVVAESNLDDDETNVGFEWRRIDWTDDFESRTGAAYLYEGIMEGYIRNLNADRLWKFRPYYTSNAGNTYYSDWKGMDPSDYSFFEPTVHTYEPIAVTDSTAEVKGYAMQGTDDVASQGFMYWQTTSPASSRMRANGAPEDATVVEVPGHVMKTTLAGLEYDTEYCFVAFVKTGNGAIFYGEQQSFRTTSDPDGIKEIKNDEIRMKDESWYDLSGRKLAKPQKGINIVRYSDGTSKKVLIK